MIPTNGSAQKCPSNVKNLSPYVLSNFIIGSEFKMLGKNGTSTTRDASNCLLCDNTRGPVGSKKGDLMSFSGGARLRTATTNMDKKYYDMIYIYI